MDVVKTILVYLWAPVANVLWWVNTAVMGTASVILWPIDRSGKLQHGCARWWCRMIVWSIFSRIRVQGAENVRPGEAYVYMANHASLLDTPALFAGLPHPFRIMAKRGLFWIPFMGWHLWTAGNFPIDRGEGRRTAMSLRRVIDRVSTGRSLAVFPEGTRTRDGRLQELKPGAFKIALRAGVPIVPISIRGTFKLLPRSTLVPRPGRIDVVVGAPIDTRPYGEGRLPELIQRTREAIQAGLEETAEPVPDRSSTT
jgi:1-acyl-sn-glycerol-3-phosphate acyltransferase